MTHNWSLELFNKSVLKQQKYRELSVALGAVDGRRCLDIGSDNGVISYLLREQGGSWASADLDAIAVESIRSLVQADVHLIDEGRLPFMDQEFDRVVIVDLMEHVVDDHALAAELRRILKLDGILIVNVPHLKPGLLRRLRYTLGQTDEAHGHVRPGYTPETLQATLAPYFTVNTVHTYSKFFSEFIDTMIVFLVSVLKRRKAHSRKGLVVTGSDMTDYRAMFRAYSAIYPLVWLFSKLDLLLFFRSGYMLLARAIPDTTANTTSTRGGYASISTMRTF